ncbi:uncharacterized protein HHUB_4227 (plasmid) [Halobacterium hubeiense]|uniref:Uncharacterized protein n=1 Tax=Halobacterium hubeiense TaxID=1407499 RepID=A0A0U5H7E2_9EURY|nr:hypothetical protein [Halobacterium hubeiense]CQH63923.1 uncharacterized protein HHUB_4227 [Halobacterium hubeiense]
MSDDRSEDKVEKGKSTRSGRRTFLKTVAIGSSIAFGAGHVSAATDEEVTITEARVPMESGADAEYEVVEKDVPKDWHEAVTHATEVHDREKFYQRDDVVATLVNPDTFDNAEPSIEVEVKESGSSSRDSISPGDERSLPDSIGGVPVEKKKVEETSDPSITPSIQSACGTGDYGSTPPGGVECSGSSPGTLSSPLVKDGTMYFATCWHIFGSSPVDDSAELSQSDGNTIGKVTDGDSTDDFVACEPANGHTPTRELYGTNYKIWGNYTKSGVQALAADNKSITKQGVGTCETSGEVRGVGTNVFDGSTTRHEQVRWGSSSTLEDGDSGAVAYRHHQDDKVLAVAMCGGVTSPYNLGGRYAFGTGAYHINQEYGYGW